MGSTQKEFFMRHWNKIIIGIIAIFILAGCAAQEAPVEKVTEPVVQDVQEAAAESEVQEPQPMEEIKEPIIEEPVITEPEPVAEKKEEFQIFNPVLTYDGAYNRIK